MLQGDQAQAETFFANLGVYLTLERAQRLYGFEAERYGLDDAQAADIAAVFARVGQRQRRWLPLWRHGAGSRPRMHGRGACVTAGCCRTCTLTTCPHRCLHHTTGQELL